MPSKLLNASVKCTLTKVIQEEHTYLHEPSSPANQMKVFCTHLCSVEWLQVTGLIHDMGKVLALWGEPQWAVVGDTFPVGCQFSDKCVFYEKFEANPDDSDPRYK